MTAKPPKRPKTGAIPPPPPGPPTWGLLNTHVDLSPAEQIKELKAQLAVTAKQRDDALHHLTGQANVLKTLALFGDLLTAIEKAVGRLQRIARALGAGPGED